MKIWIKEGGKIVPAEIEDGYARRLYEQGRAWLTPPPGAEVEKPAENVPETAPEGSDQNKPAHKDADQAADGKRKGKGK